MKSIIKNLTNFKAIFGLIFLTFFSQSVNAAEVTLAGNITTDTTWSASNEYILDKPIFVIDGATLTIEAGTTIYGTENLDAG
ncbi:MAG: hypothetical protein CMO36_04795, partial [Verrucomicrobiaceae bacterium]|nr:hypothetical protein [Verrucomicrobiaceae bacterium]